MGLGLILGCTLVFPGVALAGGDHKDHRDHKAGKAMGTEQFQKMDSNADGKLSPEEHAAGAKAMFATMDADKDGKVTALEMETAHDQMKKAHGVDGHHKANKAHAGKMDLKAAEKIKVVDTNGDGALSAEEHNAGTAMMFTKMDTDKDGFLSKEEMAKGHAKMLHKKARD